MEPGWRGGAKAPSLAAFRLTGRAQWGHSPACSARQSAARPRRARSTGDLMVRRRLLGLGLPLPARGPVYTLGCGPGARSVCQGYLGVIRPSSAGQTPKDVVVGAAAAWEGPWVWRGRRVSPGPLRGPLQVPQRLLTLPWSPFPSLSSSCVWTARRGVGAERGRGATASQGGVADRRRLPLSAVGRSQTPEVGPAMPSFTLHEGSGRLGRRGPTPARPLCQDGRGRGPSQELSTNRGGAGPGHRPVRWGPWPCPLTGPLRARMWSAPVGS